MLTVHCLSTVAELKNKIAASTRKNNDQLYSLDTRIILHRISRGEDIFGRWEKLCDRVDDNPDVPAYLKREENRQEFAYMIDRDPPNANFRDIQQWVPEGDSPR